MLDLTFKQTCLSCMSSCDKNIIPMNFNSNFAFQTPEFVLGKNQEDTTMKKLQSEYF